MTFIIKIIINILTFSRFSRFLTFRRFSRFLYFPLTNYKRIKLIYIKKKLFKFQNDLF